MPTTSESGCMNNGMSCPTCGGDTKTKDTRRTVLDYLDNQRGPAVRRRRQCLKCKSRFTTYELPKNQVIQS